MCVSNQHLQAKTLAVAAAAASELRTRQNAHCRKFGVEENSRTNARAHKVACGHKQLGKQACAMLSHAKVTSV